MKKRIPYSLYKSSYNEFPASDYDSKTKTIIVELPFIKRRLWPKTWGRVGNHYTTPGGCTVYFWNTGLAQNYMVEKFITIHNILSKTIPAGIDSFDRMLQTVAEFEEV